MNEKLKTILIDNKTSKVWFLRNYLSRTEQIELMNHCKNDLPYIQHEIKLLGKKLKQPRLSCNLGRDYTYSGATQKSSPITDKIELLMDRVNKDLSTNFNQCLVNRYRNGSDYISNHSDNESALSNGIVAGISLGEVRTMVMKNKKDSKSSKKFELPTGSIFVMEKDTQKNWTHGIPKQKSKLNERISLTFREFKE